MKIVMFVAAVAAAAPALAHGGWLNTEAHHNDRKTAAIIVIVAGFPLWRVLRRLQEEADPAAVAVECLQVAPPLAQQARRLSADANPDMSRIWIEMEMVWDVSHDP